MNGLVENYPLGYPRLAAFISSHPAFGIVRRFRTLQARLVLLHQDRLSEIEARLSTVDTDEEVQLFLSSRRRDENDRRRDLLAEAEQELQSYDRAISRYQRMSLLSRPTKLNMESLSNWMDNCKPLVRSEIDFLRHRDDLGSLAIEGDRGALDELAEWLLVKCVSTKLGDMIFTSKETRATTHDPFIHLYSPSRVELFSRLLMTFAVVVLLLLPMIALYSLKETWSRFACVMLSMLFFTALLAIFTRARKAEIFGAAAAYGAVLVVYVVYQPQ